MKRINEKLNYHFGAKKNTFEIAKVLRKNSTPAEKILWQILRNRQFEGYKFRRQHSIGRYVADFYCHKSKLVIELDGKVHEDEEQKKYDRERDEFMNELGLKVLRIRNEDLINKSEAVFEFISKNL